MRSAISSAGILRSSDQAVVAVGVLVSVLAMAATWLASGGPVGKLTEPGDRPRLSAAFQLDVNTASAAELDLLPNIGEARTGQIIAERQRGVFASPEDLAYRIKGIGPKTVEKMRPYLLPMGEAARLRALSDQRPSPRGSVSDAVPLASVAPAAAGP